MNPNNAFFPTPPTEFNWLRPLAEEEILRIAERYAYVTGSVYKENLMHFALEVAAKAAWAAGKALAVEGAMTTIDPKFIFRCPQCGAEGDVEMKKYGVIAPKEAATSVSCPKCSAACLKTEDGKTYACPKCGHQVA